MTAVAAAMAWENKRRAQDILHIIRYRGLWNDNMPCNSTSKEVEKAEKLNSDLVLAFYEKRYNDIVNMLVIAYELKRAILIRNKVNLL